jgi:hypothetical protein
MSNIDPALAEMIDMSKKIPIDEQLKVLSIILKSYSRASNEHVKEHILSILKKSLIMATTTLFTEGESSKDLKDFHNKIATRMRLFDDKPNN